MASPTPPASSASVLERPDLFLAAVSHEVRAPLHSILAATELLRDEADVPEARRNDLIDAIDHSARHLLEVITDILDLTRVQSNRMVFDIATVSLADVVDSSLVMVRRAADRKAIVVNAAAVQRDATLRTDGRRLKQVLVNLLDNAIKFTPPGGTVSVDVDVDGRDGVRLAVRDTGVGIPDNIVATIFEPFSQSRNAFVSHYGGTGLGLPVVKGIVESLGGTVDVTTRQGAGSVFAVWLPTSAQE
jgi:signal transduction histidine kinase